MAKSTSFFGLRRGSTKSLTFQVLDGKQVTKDRVSVVANPKTSAQATQRQKLLPAVRFQAIFHDLIDHSWENVQYGQKSIQQFMKKALRANIINGMVKGQSGWVPNPYQISEGSLPSMGAAMKGNGLDTFECEFGAQGATDYAGILAGGLLQEGDQLTFINVYEAGTNEQGIVYGMLYDRLIVNAENIRKQGDDMLGATQKGLFYVNFTNNEVTVSNECEGCAVILSRRTSSKWLRSSEYLDTHAVDADIQRAIESYMQANVAKTSPWYLNAADNNVIDESDLNSGEWTPMLLAKMASPGTGDIVYLAAKNNLYGNIAFVSKGSGWSGVAYHFDSLSSSKTLQSLTLADFVGNMGDTAEVVAAYTGMWYAANLGATTLAALADGQPDEVISGSKVGL